MLKTKNFSKLGKTILVIAGFILCILKWTGILPNADIKEIWYAVAWAYAVGFGTIDFNIIHDSWVEKKNAAKNEER